MTTKIDPNTIEWNKTADYYMDPIGLATILLEEYVDWGKELQEMKENGFPDDHVMYFQGIVNNIETTLDRLGVINRPVVGDC
jgi:hypothetical protein